MKLKNPIRWLADTLEKRNLEIKEQKALLARENKAREDEMKSKLKETINTTGVLLAEQLGGTKPELIVYHKAGYAFSYTNIDGKIYRLIALTSGVVLVDDNCQAFNVNSLS